MSLNFDIYIQNCVSKNTSLLCANYFVLPLQKAHECTLLFIRKRLAQQSPGEIMFSAEQIFARNLGYDVYR